MDNPTVQTDLVQILDRLEKKIDAGFEKVEARFEKIDAGFEKVDSRFEKLESRLGKVETDVAVIKTTQQQMQQELDKVSGSQKAQIWSLIGILGAAILGILATVLRFLWIFPRT